MWSSGRSSTATCCSSRRKNVSTQETVSSSDNCRSSQPVKYKGEHYPGVDDDFDEIMVMAWMKQKKN